MSPRLTFLRVSLTKNTFDLRIALLCVACPTNLIFPYLITLIRSISHGPILVATRSKAWACGLSLGGNEGSNPTGDMDLVNCALSVIGLCDETITRPEDSY